MGFVCFIEYFPIPLHVRSAIYFGNCVRTDYHFLLKPLVRGLMLTGNSLSALIFLGFSVVSFVIILVVLSRLKTKIPESPWKDDANRVKQAFTKAAYILSFILLALMYGGLLWMIALSWLPLAVYLIYRRRKSLTIRISHISDSTKSLLVNKSSSV